MLLLLLLQVFLASWQAASARRGSTFESRTFTNLATLFYGTSFRSVRRVDFRKECSRKWRRTLQRSSSPHLSPSRRASSRRASKTSRTTRVCTTSLCSIRMSVLAADSFITQFCDVMCFQIGRGVVASSAQVVCACVANCRSQRLDGVVAVGGA